MNLLNLNPIEGFESSTERSGEKNVEPIYNSKAKNLNVARRESDGSDSSKGSKM
jgi:hypothetical protein